VASGSATGEDGLRRVDLVDGDPDRLGDRLLEEAAERVGSTDASALRMGDLEHGCMRRSAVCPAWDGGGAASRAGGALLRDAGDEFIAAD
jgi:hypothetical protein